MAIFIYQGGKIIVGAHQSTHLPGAGDALTTAAPGSSAVGDTAAAGTAASFPRSDHRHGRESFGGAPAENLGVGEAASAGVATTPSRSDHVHPLETGATPVTQAFADAAAAGVATTFARGDHRHGMPANPAADISARVYNDANISIPNATTTALTFNSERWDTDGIHSTVSNTGRLTAQTAGKYLVILIVTFAANSTGRRGADILLNGATTIARQRIPAVGSSDVSVVFCVTHYNLAVGDYVSSQVIQDSGAALDLEAGNPVGIEFMMAKLV